MSTSATFEKAPQYLTESSQTRVQHPKSRVLLRVFWVMIMVLHIGMFITGFMSGLKVWGEGCLCSEIDYEIQNTRVVLKPFSTGTWNMQIMPGDVLLAVDGVLVPTKPTYESLIPLVITEHAGETVILTVQTPGENPRDIPATFAPGYPVVAFGMKYGFSLHTSIAYYAFFDAIVFLGFAGAALLIGWKRSDDWMALYSSWTLISYGLVSRSSFGVFAYEHTSFLIQPFVTAVFVLDYNFLMIFPDGKYKPRAGIAVVFLWFLHQTISDVRSITQLFPNYWTYYQVINAIFVVVLLGMMVYRYRHFFSASRRQQTKWLVFSICVSLFIIQSYILVAMLLDMETWRLFNFITYPMFQLSYLLIPIGATFAVLRYRLWDIDLTINRSLVYGIVSVLLGGVFFLVCLIAQAFLTGLFGSQQLALAAFISALAVLVCFNPTHKRVRAFVDRRIYGFRFDLNQLKVAQKPIPIAKPGALTGKVLGGYELLGVLGKGGMGEVYQGVKDGCYAAIKILSSHLVDHPAFVKRFEREGQALIELDHPNIVKVYQAGQTDDIYYIAMEFIEGEDLSTLIRQQERIAYRNISPFMARFSDALDFAHQKGFVHRDIKPGNIMLRAHREFEAVLMDFGIAKVQDASANLTGTSVMGTIGYMAPEQIMASSTVDARSDIYALGVVLYEMITGELPFKGSVGHVLFAHLQQPAPDASQLVEDLPPRIAQIIQKAMAKDVTDRFQTVGELRASLDQAFSAS